MSAIVAEGLVKIYRSRKSEVRALDGVGLTVEEGTVLGLLRPSGAGKTTTVRILATHLRPDAGHATVAGFDAVGQAQELRRVIGLRGQYAAVDENLTGRENLWIFGRLYQLSSAVCALGLWILAMAFAIRPAGARILVPFLLVAYPAPFVAGPDQVRRIFRRPPPIDRPPMKDVTPPDAGSGS